MKANIDPSVVSAQFVRVNTNAPTRLTISSFLATICLSTFAVFLPTAINIGRFDVGAFLALGAEILLGAASVFFLVVAVAMSSILIRFGTLDSAAQKSLIAGTSLPLSSNDEDTIYKAVQFYDHAIRLVYWGVTLVLLSLPLIGFHVHIAVGIGILVAFLVVGIHLRRFLWFALRR